jgi:hypothetical protein
MTATELITQNNTELAPMTRREAEEETVYFQQSEAQRLIRLYLFWKRSGHKAMGFSTFEEYCETCIETPRATVYAWIQKVEATIDARALQTADLYKPYTNEKELLLPFSITRELHKLPTPELRRKVYTELEAMRGSGSGVEQQYITDFKNRVKQLLAKPGTQPEPPKDNFTEQDYPTPTPPDAREAIDAEPVNDTRPKKPPVSSYVEKFDDGDFTDEPKEEQKPEPTKTAPKIVQEPDWILWENELQTVLSAVKSRSAESIPPHMIIGTMATLNEIVAWIEEAV